MRIVFMAMPDFAVPSLKALYNKSRHMRCCSSTR